MGKPHLSDDIKSILNKRGVKSFTHGKNDISVTFKKNLSEDEQVELIEELEKLSSGTIYFDKDNELKLESIPSVTSLLLKFNK